MWMRRNRINQSITVVHQRERHSRLDSRRFYWSSGKVYSLFCTDSLPSVQIKDLDETTLPMKGKRKLYGHREC